MRNPVHVVRETVHSLLLIPCLSAAGVAVHRLVLGRHARSDAVQHQNDTADEHRRQAVHGVVRAVHVAVLRAADDVHHGAVRAHRAASPALRQAEAHDHGAVVERREKGLVAGVQGQLVVESAENAR